MPKIKMPFTLSERHYTLGFLFCCLMGGLKATKNTTLRAQFKKLAAFYWPLLITIYLGGSLWTMSWGVTWIVWPVGAVLFIALVGLMELLDKDEAHSAD
ncbi:hypothetical protein [Shewanella sp. 30m-9]